MLYRLVIQLPSLHQCRARIRSVSLITLLATRPRLDVRRFTLCVTLTSPFMPVMEPKLPLPVLPGVKKLTTEAGVAVPAQPRAEAAPALPLLVLQTAMQLLPPPRLFFLRLAPRLASVGLIFFHKRSETTCRPDLAESQVEWRAQSLGYKSGVAI